MIRNVNWKHILLNYNSENGYRVARRTRGPPPVANSGTETVMSPSWNSSAPPYPNYIFAFWSLVAVDNVYPPRLFSQIFPPSTNNSVNASFPDARSRVDISANAYYVPDFAGIGPGGHGSTIIDAFDIQLRDFIPDDFVDVTPDQDGMLSTAANNGHIDTTTQISQANAITIRARNYLSDNAFQPKEFAFWVPVTSLIQSSDPNAPVTVGQPDNHDIVVHHNDTVIAFAFYNQRSFKVPEEIYYDWPLKFRVFELEEPGWSEMFSRNLREAEQPLLKEFKAALALVDTANKVSPQLRGSVLELLSNQVLSIADRIREEIKTLGKKTPEK